MILRICKSLEFGIWDLSRFVIGDWGLVIREVREKQTMADLKLVIRKVFKTLTKAELELVIGKVREIRT